MLIILGIAFWWFQNFHDKKEVRVRFLRDTRVSQMFGFTDKVFLNQFLTTFPIIAAENGDQNIHIVSIFSPQSGGDSGPTSIEHNHDYSFLLNRALTQTEQDHLLKSIEQKINITDMNLQENIDPKVTGEKWTEASSFKYNNKNGQSPKINLHIEMKWEAVK